MANRRSSKKSKKRQSNGFFLDRFYAEIQKEGHTSLETFVNNHIKSGGTFKTIHEWCLTKGMNFSSVIVWKSLRDYLTIPYSYEDYFWYKWDAIARQNGFPNAEKMLTQLAQKKNVYGMAKFLQVKPDTVRKLIDKIHEERKSAPTSDRRELRMVKDVNGFTRRRKREEWSEICLREVGCSSLEETIHKLRREEKSYEDIAKLFNTTTRNLRYRMKRANIDPDNFRFRATAQS